MNVQMKYGESNVPALRVPAIAFRPRKAFTLVELLVVILIISVLIALLLPALAAAHRLANTVLCANNQRQIYLSYAEYASDNEGFCPPNYVPWTNSFGNSDPRKWDYANMPYLTNKPFINVNASSAPNYTSSNAYYHLSKVYVCPEAMALDPADMGLTYSDGLSAIPSYNPNFDFYENLNTSTWYDPKLNAPVQEYPHVRLIGNPGDAALLVEINTPFQQNATNTVPYSWWNTSPANWWNFGENVYPWRSIPYWRFGFFHGSDSAPYDGIGSADSPSIPTEVGSEMNVTFFDGHVTMLDFPQLVGVNGQAGAIDPAD